MKLGLLGFLVLAQAGAAGHGGSPLGPILDLPEAPALPPPLPPPDALEQAPDAGTDGVPPAPDDPLEFLYAHRINFAAEGAPLVTIRLMEGQSVLQLSGETPLAVTVRGSGSKEIGVPQGTVLSLRLGASQPARLRDYAQVADLAFRDKDGVAKERALWTGRGYPVELRTLGTVYGIAGRVLDNRRTLVLVGPPGEPAAVQPFADDLHRKFGAAVTLHEELVGRPHGVIQVADASGGVVAVSQDLVIVEAREGGAVDVARVEYGVGYAFHGFVDRRYRGRLYATIDKAGQLALIEALPLEELLRGLVPKEIFANASPEALLAQAVTARGEVLAKIGARHLADPYLLCAEQHCQVYGGLGGERPTTDRAVAATRGEALFSKDGVLVDSVYSAVCGGHTENNDTVWGGPPDPSLRGVSDLPEGDRREPGSTEASVRRWVSADPPGYCKLSGMAAPGKFRWTKRFPAAEVDAAFEPLGVGRVLALQPLERGPSGRAATLRVVGERGEGELRGELAIRRRLGNLNSSAFVVDVEAGADGKPAAFVLRGAGWGHGVGMCQTGAIGRAQRGQGYRQILRHYFGGAEITRIY
ncbi:MAG: SpoIID/LytB domain-containing protein [Myxococcales bacterium]